jgi:hypothetical protein
MVRRTITPIIRLYRASVNPGVNRRRSWVPVKTTGKTKSCRRVAGSSLNETSAL